MDENRLNGWRFKFTPVERNTLREALGTFAQQLGADAFLDDLEESVQVSSEEPSPIYGPLKERVAAVNKAAQKLRAALEALTPDDKEELQSFSAANIPDSIDNVLPVLGVLMDAATGIQEHITLNQHAHEGQAQARLLIALSGQAWWNRFERKPSVSKGSGVRVSPFACVMQAALGHLGWTASFEFIDNVFKKVKKDIV